MIPCASVPVQTLLLLSIPITVLCFSFLLPDIPSNNKSYKHLINELAVQDMQRGGSKRDEQAF